jgi:predicted nucleic acid-binding protein
MKPRFVLDCSVVMVWCFPDEADPYGLAVLKEMPKATAAVPAIWPLEVMNALLVAERRKRIDPPGIQRFVEILNRMPVEIDPVASKDRWNDLLSLGRRHQISAYDASYLELALRERLLLATLDGSLRRAAAAVGVGVFQPERPENDQG